MTVWLCSSNTATSTPASNGMRRGRHIFRFRCHFYVLLGDKCLTIGPIYLCIYDRPSYSCFIFWKSRLQSSAEIKYPEISHVFPWSLEANERTVPHVMSWPLSFTSFLIHYSLFMQSLNCISSEPMKVSLSVSYAQIKKFTMHRLCTLCCFWEVGVHVICFLSSIPTASTYLPLRVSIATAGDSGSLAKPIGNQGYSHISFRTE